MASNGSSRISGFLWFVLFMAAGFFVGFTALCFFNGADPGAAMDSFVTGDPVSTVTAFAVGFALCAFAAGWISRDYSWVDRLWSVLPVFFGWYYAWRGGFRLPMLCAAVLVSAWGLRLTWNFAKKDGYSGGEDYRWAILRRRIRNPLAWQGFNLGFISCFQVGLFVLFTSPLAKLSAAGDRAAIPNAAAFWAGLVLMAAAIFYESVADAQQWAFQQAKRRAKDGGSAPAEFKEDIVRGFRTTGLFSYSRHPNYFGELLTWIAVYLAASAWTGRFLDWTISGPIALCALFAGSTVFTEAISSSKYPDYAGYRRRVGAIIPWRNG